MTMTDEERRARTRLAEVIQVYGGLHARDAYEREARALWAVQVLDRWFKQQPLMRQVSLEDGPAIMLFDGDAEPEQYKRFYGEPDAARIAAAEALVAADKSLDPDAPRGAPEPCVYCPHPPVHGVHEVDHQYTPRTPPELDPDAPRGAPSHSYAIGAGGGDDGCSSCGAGQHEPCTPTCEGLK